MNVLKDLALDGAERYFASVKRQLTLQWTAEYRKFRQYCSLMNSLGVQVDRVLVAVDSKGLELVIKGFIP